MTFYSATKYRNNIKLRIILDFFKLVFLVIFEFNNDKMIILGHENLWILDTFRDNNKNKSGCKSVYSKTDQSYKLII